MMLIKRITFLAFILLALIGCEDQTKNNTSGLEACFTTSPDVLYAGTSVSFSSSCSKAAQYYYWDFGDGTHSTDVNPDHVYADAGTYDVVLGVTDADGNTASTTSGITVEASLVTEHSGVIDADEVWDEGIHLITSSVYVEGAVLTIKPGAVVRFKEGTSLIIGQGYDNSGLKADGTADKPITFTSDSDVPTPGDWDMINLDDGTMTTSSLTYCLISYGGGYSSSSAMINLGSTSVTIENCNISYSSSSGINVDGTGYFESFTNNSIANCDNSSIRVFPDAVSSIGTNNDIAPGQDIAIKSGDFDLDNATWLNHGVKYIVEGDIYIGNETGSTLTLSPGVTLALESNTSILVAYSSSSAATLIAAGTETEPIVITSAWTNKAPGSWYRIGFYNGTSPNTTLKYCNIEYGGGYSSSEGMVVVDNCSISMENCEVSYSDSYGIRAGIKGLFSSFTNNHLHDNNNFAMSVFSNNVHTIGTGNNIESTMGIKVNGDNYDRADETWHKQTCPYVITSTIYVQSPTTAKLTIEAGTTIKLEQQGAFRVGYSTNQYGVLVANGTSTDRITFTTSASVGSESPGQWEGIFFDDGTANGSVLNYCDFSYGGGYSSQSGLVSCLQTPDGIPSITNCSFSYSEAWGLWLGTGVNPVLDQNTYSNNSLGDVKIN